MPRVGCVTPDIEVYRTDVGLETKMDSEYRIAMSFPDAVGATSARDHLVRMGFTVSALTVSSDRSNVIGVATIHVDDDRRTLHRVRSVVEILVRGCEGTYSEGGVSI